MTLYLNSNELEAGVDESNRGGLIFDVYAGCVVLPLNFETDKYLQIKDSKKLSRNKRAELTEYIKNVSITYGIGKATSQEIDETNILIATMKAMHRAIDIAYKKVNFNSIKIDGPHFKPYTPPGIDKEFLEYECIIKGDSKYLNIAAASILAKNAHDEDLIKLVNDNPDLEKYDLLNNMGYGTKKHIDAINRYGITNFHRKTFGICKSFT